MAGIVGLSIGIGSSSDAQVVGDGTVNTQIVNSDNAIFIQGGTQRGLNLFHSFSAFSIPTNGSAIFQNDPSIGSIFARVTGRNPSFVDGNITTQGLANLYFINPNGITFGSNASLNVAGSVTISTASGIYFQDGSYFNALNPNEPLLTVSLPQRLDFTGSTGSIAILGRGHQVNSSPFGFTPVMRPGMLSISPLFAGGSLAFIGGDVLLDGGGISTSSNSIQLGAVKSGSVGLQATPSGMTFDFSDVSAFSSIHLRNRAWVGAAGIGNNAIKVNGNSFYAESGSVLFTQNIGSQPDFGISIHAKDINISGGETGTPTLIATEAFGVGKGGRIELKGDDIFFGVNSEVRTVAYLSASGGDISLGGNNIAFKSNVNSTRFSNLITSTLGAGRGGNIDIKANNLLMAAGANLTAYTFSRGNGGYLKVDVGEIKITGFNNAPYYNGIIQLPEFDNYSTLSTTSLGAGRAGNVQIRSNQFALEEGGKVGSLALSSGDTGSVLAAINNLKIAGYTDNVNFSPSQLLVNSSAIGNAGDLTLFVERLELLNGGNLGVISLVSGDTGNAQIYADDIVVSGTTPNFIPSVINSATFGTGDAGDLEIKARRIRVDSGGRIDTTSLASGDAGNLTIDATEQVYISGKAEGSINTSLIDASTKLLDPRLSSLFNLPERPTGFSGSVRINTPLLTVNDGATISVENSGFGNAGSLTINADNIYLFNRGSILANSFSGEGGNIFVNANLLFMNGGVISASADNSGNGGNVNIQSQALIANKGSQISTDAYQGNGGNIFIVSPTLFVSGNSKISASSTLGIDGVIAIDSSDFNSNISNADFEVNFAEQSYRIAQSCMYVPNGKSFLSILPSQSLSRGLDLPLISIDDSDGSGAVDYEPVLVRSEGGDWAIAGVSSNCS